MKITLWRTFPLTLCLIAAGATTAYGDPIARWLGPWSPTFNRLEINTPGTGGDAQAFRGFGDRGDSEILPDTAASAYSRSTADSATFGSGSARTGVAFNRSFILSDSPNGWDVTLSGRLVGLLFTANPTAPVATVSAGAEIIGGGPVLTWGPTTVTPGFQRSIDDAKAGSAHLADGTYNVIGFLNTFASVDATGNVLKTGSAKADFASQGGDGFFVGVDATPSAVPEPSVFVLLGTGLIALAKIRHLRR